MNRWHETIPQNIQLEIGRSVQDQMFNLPANLLVEWHQPIWLEKRWFQEASQYINIPYPEYWKN